MLPNSFRLRHSALAGLALAFLFFSNTGCQEWTPYSLSHHEEERTSPLSEFHVLSAAPQDAKFLEALGARADHLLSHCQSPEQCNRAHFLKALTLLDSNPEEASDHFEKVVESPSPHRLTEATKVWLWLLHISQHSKSPHASPTIVVKELVHALLHRDLSLVEEAPLESSVSLNIQNLLLSHESKVKALTEQIEELSREVATLKSESASVRSLQKELQHRDKKVAELTNQLDALRRIDQELKEKAAPTAPSETIVPPKEESRVKP